MRSAVLAALAAAGCVLPGVAGAQLSAVPNGEGRLTAGYSYHWYHRAMPPTPPVEKEWQVASLGVAYGATDRVTVGLHGGYWEIDYPDFPGTDYERYVAGVGLSARLVRFARASILGEFRFSEVIDYDRSDNEFHKRTRSLLTGVYASTVVAWKEYRLEGWAGPAYVRDVGKNHFFGYHVPFSDDSFGNLGVVAGARLDAFDRVVASVWLVVVDYVQPRVSLGVRL